MPSLHDIDDLDLDAWERVLTLALEQPAGRRLAGQGVALLFEKPSARTRNSTEMAVVDLGGHPVYIQGTEVGLDTRETAEDVARTLACYHRVICARVFDHALFARMGAALRRSDMDVPLVNLLSDDAHPCQAVADMLTLRECLGPLAGQTLTYVGDANNMARSLAKAALYEGMTMRIAAPAAYRFSPDEMQALQTLGDAIGRGGHVEQTDDPTAGGQGRGRALHRRVDQHGSGGGAGGAPGRLRRLHRRRRPAVTGAARSDRVALPARAPGRRDQRRRARGAPECGVAPGRAPAHGHAGDLGLGGRWAG